VSARARLAAGLGIAVASSLLLFANGRAAVGGKDLVSLLPGWRGWDDLAIAVGYRLWGDYPVAPYRITNQVRRHEQDDFLAFRDELLAIGARDGIRPHEFWRTVDDGVFRDDERFLARRWDDPGRSLLLALGFRVLGGVAPYLLTWLTVLAALPVLGWLALELSLGGRVAAGLVLLTLLPASAFVTDLLLLGYSGAGFAFLAIGLAASLSAYAWLGRPTVRGLFLRCLLAGSLFGWLVVARSASLLTLAGVALAVGIAAWRAVPGSRRRAAVIAGALAVYLAPYAAVYALNDALLEGTLARLRIRRKPAQQHDVWATIWEGLGDFDRSKGYAFLDKAAEGEVLRHGIERLLSPESEALFRSQVLRDIREDPAWYAAILARRTWATLVQAKLWPWGPRDGRSLAPATHPNEGVTDNYYALTLGSDCFRLGSRIWEAPISLLLLPSIAVALIAAGPPTAARAGARRGLGVMACVTLAALPTPVLITTSTAFEMESFVIVHFLGFAFLAQALADALRRFGMMARCPPPPRR
jgi:hypothetical protein